MIADKLRHAAAPAPKTVRYPSLSKCSKWIATAILLLVSGTALGASAPSDSANYFTGNSFSAALVGTPGASDLALFRGYVASIHDVFNGKLFCVPDDIPLSQAAAVARKYLVQRPKEWNEPAKLLLVNAIKESYPCKGDQ